MSAPTRIQRSRRKGYRMPENSKSICRPGAWGNPFKVTKHNADHYRVSVKELLTYILTNSGPAGFKTKAEAAAHAAKLFGILMDDFPEKYPLSDFDGVKHIACFCSLDQPCHGDEIIKRLKSKHGGLAKIAMKRESINPQNLNFG